MKFSFIGKRSQKATRKNPEDVIVRPGTVVQVQLGRESMLGGKAVRVARCFLVDNFPRSQLEIWVW